MLQFRIWPNFDPGAHVLYVMIVALRLNFRVSYSSSTLYEQGDACSACPTGYSLCEDGLCAEAVPDPFYEVHAFTDVCDALQGEASCCLDVVFRMCRSYFGNYQTIFNDCFS